MGKAPPIGIDLGTSFSAAAVYISGKPEVIPNKEGHRLTPSFIYYDPQTSNVSVGTTADHQGIKCISNFLFDIKRIIGRKYDDAYVQSLKNRSEYRFNIVRGCNDKTEIKLEHNGVKISKSPEEASAVLLKYLRESASEYLGADVREAVISIPAYFSNAQRIATRKAAALAGLKVLRLITEPVAGALHYTKLKPDAAGTILVYDFGGGTFDVSIIKVNNKKFEVLNIEGNTLLGGRDIDNILIQHFEEKIKQAFGEEVLTSRLLRRLKAKCLILKEKLSTQDEYSVVMECIGGNEDNEFVLSLKRDDYEKMIEKIIDRSIDLVKKCVKGAGLTTKDIAEVVLVGGVTRTPKIRDSLCEYFYINNIKTDLNPDEAVALGAAIQATLLKHHKEGFERYMFTDITPLSLGIHSSLDLMEFVIKKKSKLPTKKSCMFETTENDQQNVEFRIFEGERKDCKYNNFLGKFLVENLPKGRAGDINIEVTFILDEDGILEVQACETSTNQSRKFVITMEEYRLCQNEIQNAIEDAEKNKGEDDLFEAYVEIYYSIIQILNHILYDLDKVSSIDDQDFLKFKCSRIKSYLQRTNYNTPFDTLNKEYNKFKITVEDIIKGAIDVNLEKPLDIIDEKINLFSKSTSELKK